MNEKLKLSLGSLVSLALCVSLTVNLFHPLSYTSATSSRNVGSGNSWLDVAVIIYCAFMAYMFASTPHTARLVGRNILFTSFLKNRAVPASEIEALEKIKFGPGVRFRSRQGNIKVNLGAVNYQLINELLAANPQIRLVGL